MIKYFKFLVFLLLLNRISAQTTEKYTTLLEGVTVNEMCTDGQNIWIATNGSGIFRYDIKTKEIENFSTSQNNLKHDLFYSITANNDFVWAGSTDGLFTYDKKSNKWTQRKFAKGGQLGNWIRSVAYDKYENVVWIGRFQYLTKYSIATRQFDDYDLTVQGNQKSNNIKKVVVDGDSLVWFGSEAGLHKYYKKKNITEPNATVFYDNKFNYFNGEGEQISITSVLFDRRYMWIGLDEFITEDNPQFNIGGLYKFDRKNDWKRFDASNGFAGNGIFCLEKTGNYIWAGLYQFGRESKENFGRGLLLINRLTNQIKPITDSSLPATVLCMYFDGDSMWLGSKNGITIVPITNKLAELKKRN